MTDYEAVHTILHCLVPGVLYNNLKDSYIKFYEKQVESSCKVWNQ